MTLLGIGGLAAVREIDADGVVVSRRVSTWAATILPPLAIKSNNEESITRVSFQKTKVITTNGDKYTIEIKNKKTIFMSYS
ncbi:hypothetical protein [Sodalis sp. RH16]|uniref:hypothetical protein n=1 Tax=unclassified Sodalis (in: enterobacteria) TaxID=2636512 RepID=UPI0039B5FB06